MLDAGAIVLKEDLTVVRAGKEAGPLRTHPKHAVDLACVKAHRERWRR
jgi:putative restriction endonuclease